ncbi:MAG TPA: translation elongation factor Ts [Candidatus Dojkabacteria bacterium]|nr:translation elongation factor Ts [Candidatus Dojkabacteria bacterium]
MSISLEDIKALRDKTSAGIGLCKEALEQSGGDFNKAVEYVNARSDVIGRLRNLTGAKIGLCKIAYDDAGKDFEKAVELIKERGWDSPIEEEEEKKEGIIECYVHGKDGRLVSLAEVNCKTDFVSKNDDFRAFAHEIALQVAAMKPEFVDKDDISKEKIAELKAIFEREAQEENKPKEMIEKIVEGKLNKYYSEKCLLQQKWFKDESKTIKSLLDENVQKFGEPIKISRILVWELGK